MCKLTDEEEKFIDSTLSEQKDEEAPVEQVNLTIAKKSEGRNNLFDTKGIEALTEFREQLPLIREHLRMTAELTKAKYDALLNKGFTKEQALELCKRLF